MRNDASDASPRVAEQALVAVRDFLSLHENTASPSFLARLFGRRPIAPELKDQFRLACGEVAVVDALSQLGAEWMVFHTVPVGRGNHDLEYVVIGPAGVYSLTVRQHPGGALWINEGVLLVDGEGMAHIRDAEFEAVRSCQLLSEVVGSRVEVAPCLVISGARSITVSKPPRRVAVLATRNLRSWLRDLPRLLSTETLATFRTAASEQADWQDTKSPSSDVAIQLERFRKVQSEINQARHTRLTWVTGVLVLAWLVAFVCVGGSATNLVG